MLKQNKKPRVKIFKGMWTNQIVISEINILFIFGDNDIQKGKKGQAVIRDAKNTIGIPTKKFPSYKDEAYYTDTEYEINKWKIDSSIVRIKEKLNNENYEYIVFPENGIGTGLAKLEEKAPKTFLYLHSILAELINEYS